MQCTLKARRVQDEHTALVQLKISAQHAVGGAGGRIAAQESYPTPADLLNSVRTLQVTGQALSNVEAALRNGLDDRWCTLATDVPITFDCLEASGFYLEEDS